MLDYLKCDNGWKIGPGAGSSMIRFFSRAYAEYLEGPKSEEKLHAAAVAAGKRIGIRCLAAELLSTDFAGTLTLDEKYSIAGEIAKAGMVIGVEPSLKKIVDGIGEALSGLDEMMRWFVAPDVPLNLYSAQSEYPAIVIKFKQTPARAKVPVSEVIASMKSRGQRDALRQLSSIAKIRHCYGHKIAGIPIRPGAILVGMSGVGKTYVARAFASASNLPFFECTVGGWCLQNAKSEPSAWTLSAIKSLLSSPILIFLDELDKIQTVGSGSGSADNWWRGCQTEIMQLLDRTMGDITLTDSERKNLENSWVICAGAFQEIFKKKLGGEVFLAEELDIEITRADLEGCGLPDELLNRCGEIVNISMPTQDEVSVVLKQIETALQFQVPEKEREAHANAAICELRGWRGLEQYALQCARRAIAQLQK